jgi:RNA polymerase sigma-70 factor (ECF subfamily)
MKRSGMLHTDLEIGSEDAAQEAVLVSRARQGDEDAWTRLVRCHQEPVFRLAYLMLGNSQDAASQAEDVAQETFVRAYLKLDRFEDGRPLRPWLLAIAANLARNRQRSIGRHWAAMRRWWQAQGTEKAVTIPTLDERDDAQLLWQAIQQLSIVHQQTLYLRYFLDMSELEIAQVLEIAAGTVKSRHHRARQALQSTLKEEFPILYAEWLKR